MVSVCCSFHCIPEISTKAETLRFNPVIFEIVSERRNGSYPVRRIVLHVANICAELCGSWRQSTWMDFRLLEIDCVILAILGEFILLRQSSVMSSILLINQPVDP